MPAEFGIAVENLANVQKAFSKADRETRLGFRAGLRTVAEPTRREAEQLSATRITRMRFSPKWARMRIGITRNLVYVAPRQRGLKTRGDDPRRRPNLARLLMDRAMQPALDAHEHEIVRDFERLLDKVADDFN